ncbi:hypothetical protein [Micromonospora sp. NPDC049891]|uniref:hypothetical protein n=1 Tax=Micromonospora sp. NPDC049891 TaxID=3155655 RepID=UPI0033F69394
MSDSLPSQGAEKEIFLRALRNYSEACEPPALTPGCPFAIDLGNGGRGCLEECVTLLARYNAPPPVDEIAIGKGLGLRPRPPRPRREPAKPGRAFDCAEVYLIDSESNDYSRWRLSSLLERLRRLLLWIEDWDTDRRQLIDDVLDEIQRRGLSSDELVRFGFGSSIAVGIYSSAVISAVDDIPQSGTTESIQRSREWASLLVDHAPEGGSAADRLVAGYNVDKVAAVIAWVVSADLEDVFEWRPPTSKEALAAFTLPPPKEQYSWLVDRFTTTYLNDWAPSSQRMEWGYLHGKVVPLCRAHDMASRSVDRNELATLLAHQASEPKPQRRGPASPSASQYVSMALRLLTEGRRGAAASLFQAVATLRPRSADAYNNWAFCLLPDDPAKSLKLLDQAMELGMSESLVLVGNRLLALYKLSKFAAALTYAEDVFARWPALVGGRGNTHMWPVDCSQPKRVDDPRSYVLDLVLLIASATESSEVLGDWKRRVEAMR